MKINGDVSVGNILATVSILVGHVLETIAGNTGMARAGNEVQSRYAEFRQEHASIRLEAFAALPKATQEALQSSAREARFSAEIGSALRAAHYKVEAEYLSASSKARDGISALLRSFGEI